MNYEAQTLRRDLAGGIASALASALVVLPLALAFGVVSGLGAAAGLYGAAAVGFFAAVFGGTKVQVSGATAPWPWPCRSLWPTTPTADRRR